MKTPIEILEEEESALFESIFELDEKYPIEMRKEMLKKLLSERMESTKKYIAKREAQYNKFKTYAEKRKYFVEELKPRSEWAYKRIRELRDALKRLEPTPHAYWVTIELMSTFKDRPYEDMFAHETRIFGNTYK